MIRLRWLASLMAVTALVFVTCSFASAQTKKHARRAPMASAAPAATQKATEKALGLGFGVAESLSGTIEMVVPDQNLLVVSGPNDVPYDLIVSRRTVIVIGDKAATLQSLSDLKGKAVAVGFVPQRDGNMATRIEVSP